MTVDELITAVTATTPDITIAQKFLRALTGEDDPAIRLKFIHDSERGNPCVEREGTLKQLWPEVAAFQRQGYGTYYFLNEVRPSLTGSANSNDIEGCRALAIDCDGGIPAEWHCQPKIVVRTSIIPKDGNGKQIQKGQALWPLLDIGKEQFPEAQKRLIQHYHSDPAISDLVRVLRLPGTLHLKNPKQPQLVTFDEFSPGASFLDEAMNGLAPLQQRERKLSTMRDKPVSEAELRRVVSFRDPDAEYMQTEFVNGEELRTGWIYTIAGILATPMAGDDDPIKWEENEIIRRRICHEFSEGKSDRRGRYKDKLPRRYSGPEAVDSIIETMPPKPGGIGFGTIMHDARRQGHITPATEVWTPEFLAKLAEQAADKKPPQPSKRFEARTVAQWRTRKPPHWLIEGFIYQHGTAIIHARRGSLKSFVAADLALSVASGQPFLGRFEIERPGTVAYAMGEGLDGFESLRHPAWCLHRKIPIDQPMPVYSISGVPRINDKADVEAFFAALDALPKPLSLVIIDPVTRTFDGLNSNDDSTGVVLAGLMQMIAEQFDCSVLGIAHEGKTPGKGVRGSSAFEDLVDCVWQQIGNGKTLTATLEPTKVKDGRDAGKLYIQGTEYEIEGTAPKPGKRNLSSVGLSLAPPAEGQKAERQADYGRVHKALAMHGIVGRLKALNSDDLAQILAGPEPPEDDEEAHAEWWDSVGRETKFLNNGAVRGNLKGLFIMGQFPGGKRQIRLWFLPQIPDDGG